MKILIPILCLTMCSCAWKKPQTHTTPVNLRHEKQAVVDAKGFLSKAQSTNEEIDEAIKRLLESAE